VPITLDTVPTPDEMPVAEMQQELFEVRGETEVLNRELNARREQLSTYEQRIARLRDELSDVQGRFQTARQMSLERIDEEGRLALAQQMLSEEMQRLLGQDFTTESSMIAGIPVDSEYIIFVIDTSGSMFFYTWPKVLQMIEEVLDVHPEVRGIQVMNDMGDYMFPSFRGQWIPDTRARRTNIINTLRNWSPFSNSSPVEGITRAISTYASTEHRVSIYVFGDDFLPGGSITRVIETVDRLNPRDENGNPMVRIHAVGFPVLFQLPARQQESLYNFATLMRELTLRNGGSFVGLNEY